jgi:hypothetical protein
MAGSFDLFRKYQRSLLVFVAILAMLAFFVLPPFLQMGGNVAAGDPVVARWSGGEIREGQLERNVAMRAVVNRFLVESAAAAGRDPSRLPLFPESEEAVVRTMLVAEEARKNGVVVSDAAINDFLAEWTNNMVRGDQFSEIISGLRLGPNGVSQHDLFEAIRSELVGRNMLIMFQTGFSGDPPAWRYDYFRRLEQSATVELAPVPVESVASSVPSPSSGQLQTFFDRYKDDLPDPRSDLPGFREPRRVKYEYLVARRETYEAEAAKAVTDTEIADFYEKNKETMFRAKAVDKPKADAAAVDAAKSDAPKTDAPKDAARSEVKAPPEVQPSEQPAKQPQKEAEKGAAISRPAVRFVAFRQPAAAPAKAESSTKPPVAAPASEPAKPADKAGEKAPEKSADKPADKPADVAEKESQEAAATAAFEPLEAVKDRIREQLARERANARIDAVFTAVAGDLSRYAEDLALWQAQQKAGTAAPKAPDIDLIAKMQGLEGGRIGPVTASQAIGAGGIGQSFDFLPDPGSRFGIRQQNWIDAIFGQNTMSLRPVTSRDAAGNRYLSWKTEDEAEFVPAFEKVRDNVEFSWRIVEGRGLARRKAEELAALAATSKQSLAASMEGKSDVKVGQAGPFTWLSQGSQPGSGAFVSQPDGIEMPGDEFMRTVFSLQPGQSGVAFNEPRTICYCIRLVELTPPEASLREKFLETRSDPGRTGMVAQQEFSRAFGDWIEGLEKKYALNWTRQPRFNGR